MTSATLNLRHTASKGPTVPPAKRRPQDADDDAYRFNVTVRLPKAAVEAMRKIIEHRGGNVSQTALFTMLLLEEARRHKLID